MLASYAVTVMRQQLAYVTPIPTISSYCPATNEAFKDKDELYKRYAKEQDAFRKKLESEGRDDMYVKNIGLVLHCYCTKENPYFMVTDFKYYIEGDLCNDWKRSTGFAKVSSYLVALIIVTFNQLAYFVCLFAVDLVGFHYASERVVAYTVACSFC